MKNFYLTFAAAMFATAVMAQSQHTIITEQPEGTLLPGLYNHSEGYVKQLSTIYSSVEDGNAKDVVVGNDGFVYFKNPVQGLTTNSWMKAAKADGDTLVVTLPQDIYSSEIDGTTSYNTINRMVLGKDSEGETTYVADTNCHTIRFIMRGDSIFKAKEDASALLGLCYESGNWTGFGATSITLTKVKDTPATPATPETSAQTYAMTTTLSEGKTDTKVVDVAIEGNDIFIGKLDDDQPDLWTKGRIEDGKAIFDGGVYMGLDTENGSHVYFFPAGKKTIEVETPFGTMTSDSIWMEKQLTFDYDADAKTLKSEGGFILNQGASYLGAISSYWQPQLAAWTETVSAPGNPQIVYYEPYDDNMGYSYIQFFLDKNDAQGNQLDAKKLYYNVYVDGELMTFSFMNGYNIFDDMTDVPYDYDNQWDFFIDNSKHTLYFYTAGIEKIGIQAFYLDGDNKLASDVVTYEVNGSNGIANTAYANAKVVGVSYRDLSGRMVSKPNKGVYVKTTTYSDGTKRSQKTIIR